MKHLVFAVFLASIAGAENPASNYVRLCEGCHGVGGAGGRAPALSATLKRASSQEMLQAVIRQGIPGTEMAAVPENRLSDADLKDMAAWIWAMRRNSAVSGSAQAPRGQQLFRAHCARCHAVQGEGVAFGPDLSDAARRPAGDIRAAILDPEAEIKDSFENYRWFIDIPDNFLQIRIVTKDGRRITAARVNEDSFSIQARDADGRYYSFLKSELSSLQKDWGKSPMPGFRDVLTDEQINDLVQFLTSQRTRR